MHFTRKYYTYRASRVVLVVKNPPTNAGDVEMQVQSRGGEDPQEEGMATHPKILAWRILWTEEPGGPYSVGSQRVEHSWGDLARMHVIHRIFSCVWPSHKQCHRVYIISLPASFPHSVWGFDLCRFISTVGWLSIVWISGNLFKGIFLLGELFDCYPSFFLLTYHTQGCSECSWSVCVPEHMWKFF